MTTIKPKRVIKQKFIRSTARPARGDSAPQEVLVFDVLLKQKLIAEYRGESKQWYSQRLYKVYHPAFEGGFRLLPFIIRYLGPAGEES
jgi:hypothetical protein